MIIRRQTNNLKSKKFPQHQLYNVTKYPLPSLGIEIIPTCYIQAAKSPHRRQAMTSELDELAKKCT
jgi:hypothetical protein